MRFYITHLQFHYNMEKKAKNVHKIFNFMEMHDFKAVFSLHVIIVL